MTMFVFDGVVSQEDAQRIKDIFRLANELPEPIRRKAVAALAAHFLTAVCPPAENRGSTDVH